MSRLQPALAAPTPDSRLFALADGARYLTLDTRLEKAAGEIRSRRRTERWRDGEGSLGGGKEAFRAASRSLCLRRGCPPIPRWSDG